LIVLALLLAGCPVTQRPAPGKIRTFRTPGKETGDVSATYSIYVPTWYTDQTDWPLVVTLHGTYGWDGRRRQVQEWAYLAEERGLIVIAPALKSVQGILRPDLMPGLGGRWHKDLEADDQIILAAIDDVSRRYPIDSGSIVLTGFSAGGFPLYHTGLRYPERFQMLIARACNSSYDLFDRITLTDRARQLPIFIFWGKDDLKPIQDQSWQAFRYLRERRCYGTKMKEVRGGHLRRPEIAYAQWSELLADRHRNKAEDFKKP